MALCLTEIGPGNRLNKGHMVESRLSSLFLNGISSFNGLSLRRSLADGRRLLIKFQGGGINIGKVLLAGW